jgi:large subunit ribosomal protein L4
MTLNLAFLVRTAASAPHQRVAARVLFSSSSSTLRAALPLFIGASRLNGFSTTAATAPSSATSAFTINSNSAASPFSRPFSTAAVLFTSSASLPGRVVRPAAVWHFSSPSASSSASFSSSSPPRQHPVPDLPPNLVIHGLTRLMAEPEPVDESELLRADLSEKVLPIIRISTQSSTASQPQGEEEEQALSMVLDNRVFGVPVRRDIVHRVVVWQRANWRRGTGYTKTRADVRGGGHKPWNQKGGGRARHGSIRSPLWRGGGKAHGKKKRDFTFKLNRKVRQMGLRSALAAKWREGNLFLVDVSGVTSHLTRDLVRALSDAGFDEKDGSIMLVDGEAMNEHLALASRNLPWVAAYPQIGANVYAVVKNQRLLLTTEALQMLTERLTRA